MYDLLKDMTSLVLGLRCEDEPLQIFVQFVSLHASACSLVLKPLQKKRREAREKRTEVHLFLSEIASLPVAWTRVRLTFALS